MHCLKDDILLIRTSILSINTYIDNLKQMTHKTFDSVPVTMAEKVQTIKR